MGISRWIMVKFPELFRYGLSMWPGDKKNPLTRRPMASAEQYEALAAKVAKEQYPEIDRFEIETGYAIPKSWLSDLALHTQVVVKKSPLCYAHGRVLYSALSRYLETAPKSESVNILETGTARGFSSLCMARALADMNRVGKVVTFDTLPHRMPIYWNCIDDLERKKSRQELLKPWEDLVQKYLIFIQGDTRTTLSRVNIDRVHFAFLDGAHDRADVRLEFDHIAAQQRSGDVVLFDDYTPTQYPGIVAAVNEICQRFNYVPEKIFAHSGRGYVVAVKQ